MALLLVASSAPAAEQTWRVETGRLTLALEPSHLASLGLEVAHTRATTTADTELTRFLGAPLRSFAAEVGDLRFRTSDGAFRGFETGAVDIAFRGGLAVRARHPRSGDPLPPAHLYDLRVELDPAADRVRVRSSDPSVPVPFEVRSTSFRFTRTTGELALRVGDLAIAPEWARTLGQPYLAGRIVGAFDLELVARPIREDAPAPARRAEPLDDDRFSADGLDITLGELYDLQSFGRSGTYPNGRSGLSAATTSCNSGTVRVPWNAPMAETHPFIGLALLRVDSGGVLEMIGQNWMKHGWGALSNDQCNLGCEGCGGLQLCIGCSDTYSATHNASRYDLGPRSEVDPYTGSWTACGSFFDEPETPDPDCDRDYFGFEPDQAAHRLEVWDADMGNAGATYVYEGEYVVADDVVPGNTIGWRECTMFWTGSDWNISDVGSPLDPPTYGPYIQQWGDEQVETSVAPDDGNVILATRVTDLGGGAWHYEYALYNWYSARGIRSVSIPIASVGVSSPGFHDIDQDGSNDWSVTDDGITFTWSTDDFATDPEANALSFQSLYNFRFDADRPPTAGSVSLGLFRPGVGSSVMLSAQVPDGGVTSSPPAAATPRFSLDAIRPNPFPRGTEVSFTLDRAREVALTVLDVTGRRIQLLTRGPAPEGTTRVAWDGRDETGGRVAAGVYFFRLESGGDVRTIKGTLLR